MLKMVGKDVLTGNVFRFSDPSSGYTFEVKELPDLPWSSAGNLKKGKKNNF